MDDLAGVAVPPGGLSQPAFCRPAAPERRIRKLGSANIFQGVNLKQLRRLFQSAGEPEAERMAQSVWGGRRTGADHKGGDDGHEEEDEEGLAQALVGLRVRSRNPRGIRASPHHGNRSGVRASPHHGNQVAAVRGIRSFGHTRTNEQSLGQPAEVVNDDLPKVGSGDPGRSLFEEEKTRATWTRNGAAEKDPERYLHRVRH